MKYLQNIKNAKTIKDLKYIFFKTLVKDLEYNFTNYIFNIHDHSTFEDSFKVKEKIFWGLYWKLFSTTNSNFLLHSENTAENI
jgi:hypothetical protein